ncbi:MAG: CPBP family intramembrane metalloprotease [Planctomycetes bacterium]|nr:CPBP family intramembrane metalloprotease [Planctomycetota bacterium]
MKKLYAFSHGFMIMLFFSLIIPAAYQISGSRIFDIPVSYFVLLIVVIVLRLTLYRTLPNQDVKLIRYPLLQILILIYFSLHPYITLNIVKILDQDYIYTRDSFVLWVLFLGPITEEIIFRGVIYDEVVRILKISRSASLKGNLYPILITSILFGIWHLNEYFFGDGDLVWTLLKVANAGFMGIFAGILRYHTNSTTSPIIIHIAHNTGSYLISI